MYEEYYGFAQPPFSLTPDPRFLYRSESHGIALQQVWQAILRKEGFIVLTGDIGTGKTTLCRTILEQFDPTTFTALILNPFLSVEELLREVLLHYGIATREALRTGSLATASKHELIRTLHDFLLSLVPIHGSAVLLIDEAQHLSPEILEEIRILSNLETNNQKLLQIVLVGQLNLLDVLHDAKLRQLDQRISIRCLLRPLNREEVQAYVAHRLQVARGRTAVTFTPEAFDRVLALSGGIPRIINLICDRALMAGSRAQTSIIGNDLINEGAAAMGLTTPDRITRHAIGTATSARAEVDRRPEPTAPQAAPADAPEDEPVERALRASIVARSDRPEGAGEGVERLPASSASRLKTNTAALVALTLVVVATLFLLMGGASALVGETPPEVSPPERAALIGPPPVPAVPEERDLLTPPARNEDAYSVIVGTFASPEEATAAERAIRARKLRVYASDLRYADGPRRRLFVGRYPTRQDAERVRADLAGEFADARVTLEWFERVP